MADSYVNVRATLRAVRPSSILVSRIDRVSHQAWLPRSVLHGGDDLRIEAALVDTELSFRVREWKAREAGLA